MAGAAQKATPARRRAPQDRKPKATVSTLVDGPVEALDLDALPQGRDTDVVHLFTLNGTDYHVPAKPGGDILLTYLQMHRQDQIAAEGWALEQILGSEAYAALMTWPGLTMGVLSQIQGAVKKLLMGAAESSGPLGRG